MSAEVEALTVYAVRNAEGEWMRASGFGGGKHWVPAVADAKLYTKLAQARARVTFWANHNPEKTPPVIVAFTMSLAGATVLEETDRVAKAKAKKATEEYERTRRDAKWTIRAAEEDIRIAEEKIRKARAVSS